VTDALIQQAVFENSRVLIYPNHEAVLQGLRTECDTASTWLFIPGNRVYYGNILTMTVEFFADSAVFGGSFWHRE